MTIHELVELQRMALLAAGTRHVEERIDQLDTLHATIRQRENLICDALQADLGKRPEEAYMTEIGMVLSEISFIINHLKRWARPKRVHTPLAQFPSRSYILKEPYGVVLVMAPWNYPFQLTMNPLVGALAAGNHCIVKPGSAAISSFTRGLYFMVQEPRG